MGDYVDCSMLSVVLRNLGTPFNLLNALILSGLFAVYLAYRDERLLLDALGVSTVVLVNTAVAIVQEWRARRALENIMVAQHHEPPAPVGTIVPIQRGSMITADGVVVENHHCELDTSLVTGESLPVAIDVGMEVSSGSFCVAGSAAYRVTRSGTDHTTARIQQLASTLREAPSPLQRSIDRVFQVSFAAAVVLAAIDVALHLDGLQNTDVVRRVATLLLGLIPEGLVFFTTIALTVGAYRIATQGVIIQRLNAVESFATVDTVCMDKTGTLTENQLSVHRLINVNNLNGADATATLRSYAHSSGEHDQVTNALLALSAEHDAANITWVDAIPFSSDRKWSAQQQRDGQWWMLGAPDVLLGQERAAALINEYAVAPYRLLVFGPAHEPPRTFHPALLIALIDRVRPEAEALLQTFERSNVDVRIITGDGPGVVEALLPGFSGLMVGARLRPEQKQQVVRELQASGRHVAMIGDGINDLPAIKEANVGIAVRTSAPATKQVADIVLEERSLDVLPEIIAEGRSTITTVLRVAQLYIGKNLALLAVTVLCSLSGLPYPLTPRRGALLSVIGVAIPAIVLAARSQVSAPVSRFMHNLLLFSLRTTLASVVSVLAAWWWATSLAGRPSVAVPVMFSAFTGVLLAAMLVLDDLGPSLRKRLRVVVVVLAAVILSLTALPSAPLPLSVLTTFYEITPETPSVVLWMAVWMVIGGAVTGVAGRRMFAR